MNGCTAPLITTPSAQRDTYKSEIRITMSLQQQGLNSLQTSRQTSSVFRWYVWSPSNNEGMFYHHRCRSPSLTYPHVIITVTFGLRVLCFVLNNPPPNSWSSANNKNSLFSLLIIRMVKFLGDEFKDFFVNLGMSKNTHVFVEGNILSRKKSNNF